jgi:UDP-N-acetylglucosamine 4,6-dehydratase/5-epimerase
VLAHKTLMITGGTGSFGMAVLRRFLTTDIGEIRIFSRDEKKQEDLRLSLRNSKVKFYIGDVRDPQSLGPAMAGVDYVFHAAALKQVPSCEFYPLEAVKTNILGTENMLNAALQAGVKKVVVLSTDKAVYPINAMGLSKAMMEKVMVARSRGVIGDKTILCGTRYGNVMSSRGSVIPLFIEQIISGRPLTVTDPNMTRFLMSLDDAVDLVLFAFKNGVQGDIFVQKAPASTIGDLAAALREIFNSKTDIRVIGTRHGEKLFETLLTREELANSEDLGAYYRIPSDNRDLNYDKFFTEGEQLISAEKDYNSHNTERLDVASVKEVLLGLDDVQEALKRWRQTPPRISDGAMGV